LIQELSSSRLRLWDDPHLALAAAVGLGTHDPEQIEVLGLSVEEARHPFRWEPPARND